MFSSLSSTIAACSRISDRGHCVNQVRSAVPIAEGSIESAISRRHSLMGLAVALANAVVPDCFATIALQVAQVSSVLHGLILPAPRIQRHDKHKNLQWSRQCFWRRGVVIGSRLPQTLWRIWGGNNYMYETRLDSTSSCLQIDYGGQTLLPEIPFPTHAKIWSPG